MNIVNNESSTPQNKRGHFRKIGKKNCFINVIKQMREKWKFLINKNGTLSDMNIFIYLISKYKNVGFPKWIKKKCTILRKLNEWNSCQNITEKFYVEEWVIKCCNLKGNFKMTMLALNGYFVKQDGYYFIYIVKKITCIQRSNYLCGKWECYIEFKFLSWVWFSALVKILTLSLGLIAL